MELFHLANLPAREALHDQLFAGLNDSDSQIQRNILETKSLFFLIHKSNFGC